MHLIIPYFDYIYTRFIVIIIAYFNAFGSYSSRILVDDNWVNEQMEENKI